ncbi:MAG: hypothetical protein AB7V13_08035 [Pseudorhodoplanes sp.]|uniref:hypothetical protein n=1 Tax=Pseudorhodoplanes sp. TaxID=1934341 RepID=UPI003D0C0F45
MKKAIVATLAVAGIAVVFSLPAKAEAASSVNGARNSTVQVGHTEISSQRRHYRRHYGYRYRPYAYRGPRYGYYRPYRYYRPYYGPGVSFGFWGGPRVGVWF